MPSAPANAPPLVSVGVCGCCFVWEVTRGPHAGERLAFDALEAPQTTLSIGRKSACWLRLRKDLEVSGIHAELTITYNQDNQLTNGNLLLVLRDANSTNGTRANSQLLAAGESYHVCDQDLLQFGRTTVRVRIGNTQCSRARQEENKKLLVVGEPEDEPVGLASTVEKKNEIRELLPSVGDIISSEHSDENAFEKPTNRTTNPPTTSKSLASSTLLEGCIVCGQVLDAWSVLERQLHVNACLDKQSNAATQRPAPTVPTIPTITHANSKKRKRQKKIVDEELAVALALSESLVDTEQQVDTEMALVRGELVQIDAQLKKLQKKRGALVKKLEKLEKTKRKVKKSEVVGPAQTHVLLDMVMALRVLFPATREFQPRREEDLEEEHRWRTRPAIARLEERYRAVDAAEMQQRGEYMTLWRRSAYGGDGGGGGETEEATEPMFVNRLLQRLQVQEEKIPKDSAEGEDNVPDVVKRVFPQWQENLEFLTTQSLSDLKDALTQLREMMIGTAESMHDEADACAYFEKEMLRLIRTKEEETSEDIDVVELMDSEEDESVEKEDESEQQRPSTSPPSVLSLDDSSDEEENDHESVTSGEETNSGVTKDNEEPDTVSTEDNDVDMEDQEIVNPSEIEQPEPPEPTTAPTEPGSDAGNEPNRPVNKQASLEQQLLTALKANAIFYERVLLLQPVNLQQLLEYIRNDVGIKCPKTALVRFCDQHGITFKSS